MSIIGDIYGKLVTISPTTEVLMRMLYWNNVEKLAKFSPNQSNRIIRTEPVKFEDIINFLSRCGIGEGSLVVLHSSFDNLKPIDLNREEIVERILNLVGSKGTLAAPVIRKFKETAKLTLTDELNDVQSQINCIYDVNKSKITSGVLAFTLMHHKGSVTSRHPLNPLTAVGPLARPMMEHNIEGNAPSPHGPNSCWKFCADHDAFIVHLGVNFGHHLTMQHVVAECNPDWRLKDFFLKRPFTIIDGDFEKNLIVSERRLKWTRYIPENNNRDEMVKHGIAKVTDINGIPISVIRAKDMINFYKSRRKGNFPYLFPFGRP